jgi:hypothetical protein
MLTAERVREVLNYDPETGIFTWRKKTGRKAKIGKAAGVIHSSGRVFMSVDGHKSFGHRIAWLHVTGEWPAEGMTIDHINGDPSDNRWCNLRLATRSQNQANRRPNCNSSSGVKGVEWHPQSGKWRAKIGINRKAHHIGLFTSKEEAGRAYLAEAQKHFGEFATSGERPSPRSAK